MTTKFEYRGFEFELLDGEYRRYRNELGELEHAEHLCLSRFNGNQLLLQYMDSTGVPVNYVQTLFENIPDFAFEYLMNVLEKKTNVLVRLIFISDAPTSFEIYYECDICTESIDETVQLMVYHNDFAAMEYRYTEVANGHQKCVGT